MIRALIVSLISAFTLAAQTMTIGPPPKINTTNLWTYVFRSQTLSAQLRRGSTPALVKQMGDTAIAYAAELESLQKQCGGLYMLGYLTDPKTPFAGQIICKPKPSAGMFAAEKR